MSETPSEHAANPTPAMPEPDENTENRTMPPIPDDLPRKVLFLESGVGFGGSILSLADLIRGFRELAQDGAAAEIETVVVSHLPESITDGLFPFSEVIRVPIALSYRTRWRFEGFLNRHALLRSTRSGWLKLYSAADRVHDQYLISRITGIAKKRGVELLHLNNGFTHPGIMAGRRLGIPCVAHLRGFVGRNWKRIDERYGDWIWDTLTCSIGVSEAVSQGIRDLGVPQERIRAIHNPIAHEGFEMNGDVGLDVRRTFGIPEENVVASVFGRLTPWKGQWEFLQGIRTVVEDYEKLSVMIVGDESDAPGQRYLKAVRALAEEPPLKGRVIFTGYQKEVARFFRATDIMVHCSIEPEPFGRTVPEGMASGCAVIGMDEGGPQEVITHGEDGWLVPPRDPEALGEAVRTLYHDPELRERLARKGRKTVERRLSPRRHARKVMACYSSESQPSVTPGIISSSSRISSR